MIRIEAIYSFPVKSCAAIELPVAEINSFGLPHDRTFMVVDPEGRFITQRQYPVMSRIFPEIISERLILKHGTDQIDIDLDTHPEVIDVSVWRSRLKAQRVSQNADLWLSSILGEDVRLVKYFEESRRTKRLGSPFNETLELAFSDGYPIHIINQGSVEDLGKRMGSNIDPMRFRPNLIISGMAPYQEENLETIEGGNFKLRVVKTTGRCKIPNVDPKDGEMNLNVLGELSLYKKTASKVNFGIYAYPLKSGEASNGESLSICYK